MATIDDAYASMWKGIKSTIPLNPTSAIFKEWRKRYAEWGSPISGERPLDDEAGAVFQCFSHAIVTWRPSRGIEVVVET